MELIKRVILTANGLLYKTEEPEVSNRVLRIFKKYDKFFIRLK